MTAGTDAVLQVAAASVVNGRTVLGWAGEGGNIQRVSFYFDGDIKYS